MKATRRSQTKQTFSVWGFFFDFLKYRTVGGVIWLGDPALAAGGAGWRGGVAWPDLLSAARLAAG